MIRIAVADSHRFVHDSLEMMCRYSDGDKRVLLHAFCPDELEDKLERTAVDVIIMDVHFPMKNGLMSCKKIHEKYPLIKILIFSLNDDVFLLAELIKSGINGFLKKNEGYDALQDALTDLIRTGYYYRYDLGEIMRAGTQKKASAKISGLPVPDFSAKEITIINLVRKEYTNKQIAEKMGLHVKTIEMHKRNMIEKTNSRRIIGVVDFMVANGIIARQAV